jgi:hypothetical protein
MFGGKHGFAGALEPATCAELRRLYRGSVASARIMRASLAGLFWRLRRDTPPIRRDARSLLIEVAGPGGATHILAEHLADRRGGSIDASLRERCMPRVSLPSP